MRGLEFADYRPYTPGDELRRIDWNIYARLHELFVKVAPSEAHIGLSLLIDGSRSMEEGTPSKLRYAQRLAAMLGAVALLRADITQIHMLADGQAWAGASLTSPRLIAALIDEIDEMPRGQHTDLASSIRSFRRLHPDTGVVVLISDALTPADQLDEALVELSASGRSCVLLHVLDRAELSPSLAGPVELRERETGEHIVIDVTPAVREQYERNFERFRAGVAERCAANGISYLGAYTDIPPLELLFAAARRDELVSL